MRSSLRSSRFQGVQYEGVCALANARAPLILSFSCGERIQKKECVLTHSHKTGMYFPFLYFLSVDMETDSPYSF